MKIMLMTDMEGCAGILNHDDWVLAGSRWYEKGLRLLTAEVNAAVDGLYAGGAREVVVVDGHGAGGIDPEILDARAQLMRGIADRSAPYPWGMDNGFDAVGWIGQHAKAGTDYSHITHTQWFNYLDEQVNGLSIGEYGEVALCAMELGVPCILACGEEALCREAEALTPGVVTVSVKKGLLTDGLKDADADTYRHAKLSALHLAPAEARRRIRVGAEAAIVKLKRNRRAFRFPKLKAPYEKVVWFRASGKEAPCICAASHPTSVIGLMNQPLVRRPQ